MCTQNLAGGLPPASPRAANRKDTVGEHALADLQLSGEIDAIPKYASLPVKCWAA